MALVSASRRTDIPAFFMPWFMARLRAGWCEVANPFRPSQVRRVDLRPAAVDAIVFWTRDPRPLLPCLPELEAAGYACAVLVTLTAYGAPLEPGGPDTAAALAAFTALAGQLGPGRVAWRYDPILFSERFTPAWHVEAFSRLAGALAGATDRCIISVLDVYRKTARGLGLYEAATGDRVCRQPLAHPGLRPLLETLAAIARDHGMHIQSCADPGLGPDTGIAAGACIDTAWLARGLGRDFTARRHTGQRPDCLCAEAIDIGANNTCRCGCLYCYATADHAAARHRPPPPATAPRLDPAGA